MPRARARTGKYLKAPKIRRVRPRPRNENAYQDCSAAMKKLLKKPNKKNWKTFRRAQLTLLGVNQTMAKNLMRIVKENVSVKKLEKFKKTYW